MPLLDDLRAQLRRAAELTGDKSLLATADATRVTISLDHLRGLDLDTRIVCGVGIRYTEEETRRCSKLTRTPPDRPDTSSPELTRPTPR